MSGEKVGVTTVETNPGLMGFLFGGATTRTTVPATKDDLPKKEEPELPKIDTGNFILNFVIESIFVIVGTIGGYILFQKVGGSASPIMLGFLLILNIYLPGLKYLIIMAVALLPIFYGRQIFSSATIKSFIDLATKNIQTTTQTVQLYRPKLSIPKMPQGLKMYKPGL